MTDKEIAELFARYNTYKDFEDYVNGKEVSIETEEFEITATLSHRDYFKIPDIRQYLVKYHKFLDAHYEMYHNYDTNTVTFKQKQRRVKQKIEPPKFRLPADYLEKIKEHAAKIAFINKKRAEENVPPLGDNLSEGYIDAEFQWRWEKELKELIEKAQADQKNNNQPPKETRQPLDLFSLKDLEESN